MVKLCRDCKYFSRSWFVESEFSKCAHPEGARRQYGVDLLIEGRAKRLCSTMRQDECGYDAKLFEAK